LNVHFQGVKGASLVFRVPTPTHSRRRPVLAVLLPVRRARLPLARSNLLASATSGKRDDEVKINPTAFAGTFTAKLLQPGARPWTPQVIEPSDRKSDFGL
jgi:hypothetical protein